MHGSPSCLRYTSRDMKPSGHVVGTLFLMRQPQARSVENGLLQGQNFVSVTCCMKFSWFEFVHHKARSNWPPFSMLHHANCLLYDIEMNQYSLGVPACALLMRTAHVLCSCSSCVYTRRGLSLFLIPASCLLMCADLKLPRACLFFFFFNEAKGCAIPKVKQRLTEQKPGFD